MNDSHNAQVNNLAREAQLLLLKRSVEILKSGDAATLTGSVISAIRQVIRDQGALSNPDAQDALGEVKVLLEGFEDIED